MAKEKKATKPPKEKQLPPNKQLKKMLEEAGRILSAKEVKKIAESTDFGRLKIAQEAAEAATKAGTTTQFSAKLAKQLSKEAKNLIPKQKQVRSVSSGTLNSGYGVYSELAQRAADAAREQQIRKNLKDAGLRPSNLNFVEGLSGIQKFDKGQLYSTGKSGVGSIIPRDALKVKTQKIVEEQGPKRGERDFNQDVKAILGQATKGMGGLSEADQAYLDTFAQIFAPFQEQFSALNQQQSMFDQMLANFSNSMQGFNTATEQAMSAPRLYGAGQNYNVNAIRSAQAGASPMADRSQYMRSQGMGISGYPAFGYGVNV